MDWMGYKVDDRDGNERNRLTFGGTVQDCVIIKVGQRLAGFFFSYFL